MKVFRTILPLMSLLALLGVVACNVEERAAETAVHDYNRVLIEAYRVNDGTLMREVAWEEEVVRLIVLTDLKASNELVLESTLEEMEFLGNEKMTGDIRHVQTRERWSYYDRPIAPGGSAGKVVKAQMTLQYVVQRDEAGQWKVKSVKSLTHEYLENGPEVAQQTEDGAP